MENTGRNKRIFLMILSIGCIIALAGAATYAWFSNNNKVGTTTASAKSGVDSMVLLIGPDEGSLTDTSESDVEIAQVNSADKERLMPVSTADLDTFLYCSNTEGGKATRFNRDENEENLFHGVVYLRLEGSTLSDETFNVYLDTSDESGGDIGSSDSGHLLNAARLGFKPEGQDIKILKFRGSDGAEKVNNTYIGGSSEPLSEGHVLDKDVNPVADPAKEMESFSMDSTQSDIVFPEDPLFTLKGNETQKVEIYFYLEGCDPTCNGSISLDQAAMHLAFYAAAAD